MNSSTEGFIFEKEKADFAVCFSLFSHMTEGFLRGSADMKNNLFFRITYKVYGHLSIVLRSL